MINILDKHNCCGCFSCVQRCPIQCILMKEDNEGFLYPYVDINRCIGCGVCESVCPVINQGEIRQPLSAYAAINPDEIIRKKSSSGGVFTLLAEKIIDNGGVVFGARFNDRWEVVHSYVETKQDLSYFRGSKYVQSIISNSYKEVERFLESGRVVLFSGTSCQIAGLHCFLRKKYENLISVDVVCHGVPSPRLWSDYLASVSDITDIRQIKMKDKTEGWRGYRIIIEGKNTVINERASANKYMMAFIQNLSLRPSCYRCPAKSGKSNSDITMADYWGVERFFPEMDDDLGISFVCVNTEKGENLISNLSIELKETNYYTSIPYNSCIVKSTIEPRKRKNFWRSYSEQGVYALDTLKSVRPTIIKRIINRLIKY